MASSTSKVDETTFSKKDDVTAAGHGEAIDLRLHVDDRGGVRLEPGNVDLDIEVTNVADDGILKHDGEVSTGDDITVSGRGDKDVGTRSSIFHCCHLVAFHSGLEGVDGVDLGDKYTSTIGAKRLGALKQL